MRSCIRRGPVVSDAICRTISRRIPRCIITSARRDDGTDRAIHDLLRWQVREQAGRAEDPSVVVLDTQTVHTSLNAPTGLNPGKKSRGRKRGIALACSGLVIAVVVAAASVHDNAIGAALLDKVAADNSTVTKAWTDAGFKNAVIEHGRQTGHRRGGGAPRPAHRRVRAAAQAMGGRAGLRHAAAAGASHPATAMADVTGPSVRTAGSRRRRTPASPSR
jgi:hypothetical protein